MNNMLKKKIIILIFCFIFFSAQVFAKVPNLKFNNYIADEANILSESTENIINSKIQTMRNQSSAVMLVVTLDSLENQSSTNVALEIGRKYKVGNNTNNGMVMLIAPNERQVRIEIGYGLEEVITDAKAGRIIDEYMLNYFKNNDYENAITRGVDALTDSVMNFYNKIDESTTFQQLDGNSNKTDELTISQQDTAGFYFIISFLIILILPFLCLILKIIECILSIILLSVESFIVRKCSSQKESKQVLTKFYKELKNKKPMLYKFIKFTQEGLNPSSSILPIPRGNGSGRSHSFGGGGGFGGGGAGRSW